MAPADPVGLARVPPGALTAPEAAALWRDLEAVEDLADPAALARIRRIHPEADPGLVAAIATQVGLRRRALPRLGPWSQSAILDGEAVEQATRPAVAAYRARRIWDRWGPGKPDRGDAADPQGRIADIGCGLGIDSHALAEAGFVVTAIEQDPWRAEAARINLEADGVDVICADVTVDAQDALRGCAMAYVDPARREARGPRRADGRRAPPLGKPEEWSPPWSWVVALSERMPVVAKVSPGFDPRLVPDGADIEWIDHDGETVEATVWMGPGTASERRVTAIAGDLVDSLGRAADHLDRGPETSTAGRLLIEPTPGAVRAGLVGALAERMRVARLDGSAWLTADDIDPTSLARAWHVIEEVPHAPRDLRDWLRGRGQVTWKSADTRASATDWDRRVGHRPEHTGDPAIIVITGAGRAFVVEGPVLRGKPVVRGENDASSR